LVWLPAGGVNTLEALNKGSLLAKKDGKVSFYILSHIERQLIVLMLLAT
jgi:hypothetical protein